MTALIIFRKKEFEVKHGMTIRKALQQLDIEPDSVLITLEGELVTDDQIVKENDVIKLVPVISGGDIWSTLKKTRWNQGSSSVRPGSTGGNLTTTQFEC